MYLISKTVYTETGHRLMDYDGKCAHLHGHSYKWTITVGIEDNLLRPAVGWIMDFKELKAILEKEVLIFDHALLLRYDDPIVPLVVPILSPIFGEPEESPHITATNGDTQRTIIFDFNPTAENLAKYVFNKILRRLKSSIYKNVTVVKVDVWETINSHACYSLDDCCQ